MQVTASVTNNGPQTASDVVIVFAVPTSPGSPVFQFGITNRSKPNDRCFWGNPPVTRVICPIGTLAYGDSASATYSIVPDLAGSLATSVSSAC